MKEAFGRLIQWAESSRDGSAGELGLGFTGVELAANRRGELTPEQLPPFGLQLLALCLLGLLFFVLVRWGRRNVKDGVQLACVAAAGLALLLPAWPLATRLKNALVDRFEARACAFTHITSGVRPSAWGMGIYHLDVGPRSFRVPRGNMARAHAAIVKGSPYRAFYACNSETLASLEPAGDAFELPALGPHREELGELLGFHEEDLLKNRSGRVSVHQYPLTQLGGALFFIVGLVTMGVVLVAQQNSGKWLSRVLGVIALAMGMGVLFASRSLLHDLAARRACEVAGPVTDLRFTFWKGAPVWHLSVNGEVLKLWRSDQGASLIRLGEPYRVYYLCHSKQLASLEPLPVENGERREPTHD